MSKKSKREYLQEIYGRYKKAGIEEKRKILDDPPRRIVMYAAIIENMR